MPVRRTIRIDDKGVALTMANSPRVLFVDDNVDIQSAARLLLGRRGFDVMSATSPTDALTVLATHHVDIVLLDLNYAPGATTGAEGLALLREMLALHPELDVLVVTGHSGVTIAVNAMRAGARDFIMKPWNNERLVKVLHETLDRRRRPAPEADPRSDAVMIAACDTTRQLLALADRVAPTRADLIIHGPPGSGKTMLARRIHQRSGREGPCLSIDAREYAQTPPDETPDTTWILRDVETLSPTTQRALVDRLERPGAPRILALSSLDAHQLDNTLTPGLGFRIGAVRLATPPLSARGEEIAVLATHFARLFAHRHGCAEPAFDEARIASLEARPWPQNVRELRTAMERLVLLGNDSAPDQSDMTDTTEHSLARSEKTLIEAALRRNGFNVSHAARELGLTRPALYRRMARHGL